MPSVSVIVPIYNVEKYVKDCMESLVNQTMQDIEIICVDDRGTDKSMSVVREYAARDKRIRIVRNWRNRGLSYSRNHGMKYARAPYIMFCDSDDMFVPNMCEKMFEAIVSVGGDVAVCGINIIYEANRELMDSDAGFFAIRNPGTFEITRSNRGLCYGAAWGKIFRRDIIRKHNLKFPVGLKHEDEFFWPAYTLWVKRITFISDKLYVYRRRAGSIMNVAYKKSVLNVDPIKIAVEYYRYCNKCGVFCDVRNWFWGSFFPSMFFAALKYSGDDKSQPCLECAKDFIQKNYCVYGVGLEAQNIMEHIKSHIEKNL